MRSGRDFIHPHALDYCLEAIEALWKTILEGRGWHEMNVDLDRGTPFVNVNIDFRSPVTPRHPLKICVALRKFGASSVTFDVTTYQNDMLCFEAALTSVLVVKSKMAKIAPDDWLRQALIKATHEIPHRNLYMILGEQFLSDALRLAGPTASSIYNAREPHTPD